MASGYKKYKKDIENLDRVSWDKAEELVLEGNLNKAIEALTPIVPDVIKSWVKSVNLHGIDFEEMIAEGNLALVEAVHGWKPDGYSLKNWCYMKVSTAMNSRYGKELKATKNNDKLSAAEGITDDGKLDSAETEITSDTIRQWIHNNLSQREAYITELVYFHGKSIRDIAKQEKVSPEAISKVHRRVIIKLKELL
jgi:RNA polymerase sigma factor (sigma-70 family)